MKYIRWPACEEYMKDRWLERAYGIAYNNLLACETSIGLAAGAHHFVDLWARDSLFATFGLVEKKDLPTAKTTIETFLNFQRKDGLIPYRILRSSTNIAKYFGKPSYLTSPKADFRSHQSGGLVLDGGLMTVIAAAEYVRRTGDKQFLRKNKPQLLRAMNWYRKQFEENLLSEWFLCEWADSVLKVGKTLYTNILYWRVLGDLGRKDTQVKIGKKLIIFYGMVPILLIGLTTSVRTISRHTRICLRLSLDLQPKSNRIPF